MMSFGHLIIILLIILLLFGAGKLPQVMQDLARGLKAFKHGMKDSNDDNNHDTDPNNKTDGET